MIYSRFFSPALTLLMFLVITATAMADQWPAVPVDPDTVSPSQLHRLMGDAKARGLEQRRLAALEKTVQLYDQTEYDVIFYRVEIEIDVPSEQIFGQVTLQANSLVDGLEYFEVDLDNVLTVDSVFQGGGSLVYSHSNHRIIITLDHSYDSGEMFEATVAYHGQPESAGLEGFTFATYLGSPVVSSLSEPYMARTWWPCKDRPDDKPDSMDIIITCDENLYCASNGNLVDTTVNGDGTRTFSYEVRYPIAAYLFSLAVSDYTVWTDWYHYGPDDSMPIVNHVYPDQYSYSLSRWGITPYAIGVFSDLYGPYPFLSEKYGHANFEWGGGMEHQTCTSMNGGWFGFSEPVVVHELSHQWWGDMVTCNNWHEIWLNEGFASYSEALYFEVKDGVAAYHDYMAGMDYTGGGSIYRYDTTDVWGIFSGIVYDKAAWVLHMLRHVVGDETFFDILTAYYNSEYQYRDATTEGLKAICENVSGLDLDYFFDQWIYGTYRPYYRTMYYTEPELVNGQHLTYFYVGQSQGSAPQVFTMPIDIVISYPSADPDTHVVFNDSREAIYFFESDDAPTGINVDPDNWILKYSLSNSWSYHLIPFDLDTAVQFEAYLDSVVARGGSENHAYVIVDGSLPPGLDLDTLTGLITGGPYMAGEFTFAIAARDLSGSSTDTLSYTIPVNPGTAVAGDVNRDDDVNILDIVYLINYKYKDGAAPEIPVLGDPNNDCLINILDIIYLINYKYKDGPAPLMGCAVI